MRRGSRTVALTSILALAISLGPSLQVARADGVTIHDRDDEPRHALDIEEATMGHVRSDKLEATITTFSRLSANDLDPEGRLLGFAFSTDDDASDAERFLFVFGDREGFLAVMTDEEGRHPVAVQASHPRPRTVRVQFDKRLLHFDHYLWFAFASTDVSKRCCFDAAPNRKWVIHDYGDPVVSNVSFGFAPGQTVPSTDVPVSFTVEDQYIGIAGWLVHFRETGTSQWATAAEGTGSGDRVAVVPTTEGTVMDMCIAAVDRAGNVSAENLTIVEVPMDDTSPVFTYGSGWSASTADIADFQGTRHVSTTVGASLHLSVPAGYRADLVVPGGLDGTATFTLNGFQTGSINLGSFPSGNRHVASVLPASLMTLPTNDIEVVVTGGTFAVDGFLGVFPNYQSVDRRCGLHATSSPRSAPVTRLPRPPDQVLV